MIKLRIRDLRQENYLKQRDLAEYLNVTQQTYSRYEIGDLQPSLESVILLAEFYKTSVDYILGLTNKRNKIE